MMSKGHLLENNFSTISINRSQISFQLKLIGSKCISAIKTWFDDNFQSDGSIRVYDQSIWSLQYQNHFGEMRLMI